MLKNILILSFLALLQAKTIYDKNNEFEWNEFKLKYGKNYAENSEEEAKKVNYFKNKELVNQHNALKNTTWIASLNEYSDMSWEEFNSKLNGFRHELKRTSKVVFRATNNFEASEELDYRKLGYVTEVKNQGHCGSCWAFSATGALEGQIFKKENKLVSLSEQNLIDCTSEYFNHGCLGGHMDAAFAYISDNHGIDTEESYPYKADEYECRYNEENKGGEDTGYVDIESGNDDALMQALIEIGPISIGIVSDLNFHKYKSGIFESEGCMSMRTNHAVLLVGYGTDKVTGKKYWLVKNSWGTSWGEDGYVRISREIKNYCKISSLASYPTV